MPRSPSSTQAACSLRLDLADRHALQRHEAAAHHRHALDLGARRLPLRGTRRSVRRRRSGCRGRRSSGRVPARCCVSWRVRLASISAKVTRSVMPRPERQDQRGRQRAGAVDVGERQPRRGPARPRQAPGQGHDGRSPRARSSSERAPPRPRRRSARCCGRRRPRSRARPAPRRRTRPQDDIARARPAPLRLDLVAEQARRPARRAPARAARARRRARSAGRRAARWRARAGARVGAIGSGRTLPNSGGDRERQRGPDAQGRSRCRSPRSASPASGRARPPGRPGAPRLFSVAMERALAVDEAAHRIGDADAADQQRGQPDQGQELREALDVVGEARIGVERGCGSPSRPRGAAGRRPATSAVHIGVARAFGGRTRR